MAMMGTFLFFSEKVFLINFVASILIEQILDKRVCFKQVFSVYASVCVHFCFECVAQVLLDNDYFSIHCT